MKKVTAFRLKVIAISAMLVNHIGLIFKDIYNFTVWEFVYLFIGMLTFPIMAYLLVQGYYKTRNYWIYLFRLCFFWLVSIIPFHMAFDSDHSINFFNNIIFTLMLGLLMIIICDKVKNISFQLFLLVIFTLLSATSDWKFLGIPIVFFFYKTYGDFRKQCRLIVATTTIITLLQAYAIPYYGIYKGVIETFSSLGLLMAIPLIRNYNGTLGYSSQLTKWGFYAFYPIHLFVLSVIHIFMFKN